jgi:hypothetical protein
MARVFQRTERGDRGVQAVAFLTFLPSDGRRKSDITLSPNFPDFLG